MDARRVNTCAVPPKGVVQTLQSLLLEGIAVGIAAKDDRFTTYALSTLSPDLAELLQHQLIAKNALDDYSLVMTTSARQLSLNLPFSMTDEDKCLSPTSILLAITKCESSLRSLSMSGHELTPALLEKLTSEPLRTNLESLSLVGCRVSLNAAQTLLASCTSLQHLNLNGNGEISDDLFVPVRAAGLRHGHVYATRSGSVSVSSNLPVLPVRSKAKRSRSARAATSEPVSSTDFSTTDASNTHLDMPLAENWSTFSPLSPASLSPSMDLSPSELSPYESEDCDLDALVPSAKRPCTLSTVSSFNDRFASSAAGGRFGLYSLHLSGTNITNKSIEAVSKLYPHLVDLDVSHCPKITNLTPLLLRCTSLRSLNISGSPVQSHADRLLEHVVQEGDEVRGWPFFSKLEHLLFSGSGRLDEGFTTWMQACGDTLLELRLSNKTLPEDPTTAHIHARNARAQLASDRRLSRDQLAHIPLFVRLLMPCQRLEVLDVHGMNVSASALTLLFEATKPSWTSTCQEFDVVNCDDITLDTLATVFALPLDPSSAIGNGMTWPNLKTLRLSGGRHTETLAGPVLPAIGMYACPQLQHLVLNNVRCGKPLLRPVQLAQILQKFQFLRSLEVWCCSSVSYSLASVVAQLCKGISSVLLCVVGGTGAHQHAHHHHHHPAQHGRALPPDALAVMAAAESMTMPSFLSPDQVQALQKIDPSIEWKFWRHSVDSPRQFQHIRPINTTTNEPVSHLRPEQPTNHLALHIAATGATDIGLPQRSRLIKASVLVDGIPIWGGEKSASMHQLTQSIWGLVTHNAGALPLVEDWCCACNIEEFNGVLFYDDAEYVYWDVLEPGPKAQFKFHKTQYVAAIASAMQQQWNIFKGILPKEELVHQALLFTQQHAWHQKLLDASKAASSSHIPTHTAARTYASSTATVTSRC